MKLNENFNQSEFIEWISSFLPDFSKDIRNVDVSNNFQGIKSIQTIGESSIGVKVYIIETEKDPSRRKIGLATESFTLLRDYGTPNAIIAYFNQDSSLWRLSLLTSTLTWDDGKIKKKLSNPKRQSYLLGSKAKTKTPERYLLGKGNVTDISDLKSRFSLEVVNKEFYKEISRSFTALGPLLKLPSVPDQSQKSKEFAVRLIGRIIFCWFLREKRSSSGHSLMPKDLLSFEAIVKIKDYYHSTLEPIFFEILNKQIKSRKTAYQNDLSQSIPYLNGGLFSPHDDDYYSYNEDKQVIYHNTLEVPDEWFKSLFEILETYNFTIDENTSFDEELSIDPEMLGRIFENLLAEINPETGKSARKSTGSYYTPRVIVDYMIDESIYLYLKGKTNIVEEKIRSIISYDLEDDDTNPLTNEEKEKIIQALQDIKILDPACGSGAFPMGALQKIVFILQQVDPHGQLWFAKQIQNTSIELRRLIQKEFDEKNFDYIRKLGIIRENIYGIDIQPIATEISRLRCFLTLVVDQRVDDSLTNRGIEPLPNLDFKFVTTNTLIGLPQIEFAQQSSLFEDRDNISRLSEVRNLYFTANSEERSELKNKFFEIQNDMLNTLIREHRPAELTEKLATWKPFSHQATTWFDPNWMFGIKKGFDIIIGNPPYINSGKIINQKNSLSKEYKNFYSGTADLYTYFIKKGLDLASSNGYLCYITSNKYMRAKYGKNTRKLLTTEATPILIIDFGELPVFVASTDPSIIITSKFNSSNDLVKAITIKSEDEIFDIGRIVKDNSITISKSSLQISGWVLENQDTLELKKRLKSIGIPLGKYINNKIYYGIKTGLNKAFIINEETRKYLISEDPNSDTIIKPWLDGHEILKWTSNWSKKYVIKIESSTNVEWPWSSFKNVEAAERVFQDSYPALYKYLSEYKKELTVRSDKGVFWWELRSCAYYHEFSNKKIIYNETSKELHAYIDNQGFLINKTGFMINTAEAEYLVGLLNSRLFDWYYRVDFPTYGDPWRGGRIQFRKDPNMLNVPIFPASDKEKSRIIEYVNDIGNITSSANYVRDNIKKELVKEIETKIDDIVYEIYNLSDADIKLIKRNK